MLPAWITTYGDMMSLLLTFFILLLSFSSVSEDDFKKASGALQGALGVLDGDPILTSPIDLHVPIAKGEIQEAKPTPKEVKEEIEKQVKEQGQQESVEVIEGTEGIVIRIKEGVLFDTGKAQIKGEFASTLSRIGAVINQVGNEVVIEGHTDNVPIHTGEFANNHWLSNARATQVMDYFVGQVGIQPARLATAGYGENKPLVPNDTFEGRAKNRRVEIRLLYAQGEQETQPDSVRTLIEAQDLQVEEKAKAKE